MVSNRAELQNSTIAIEGSTSAATVQVIPKFLLTFIPMAVLLLAGSVILYSIENNTLKRIVQNREIAILDKQETLIKSDIQAVISDLL